jgi:hypothetical protein
MKTQPNDPIAYVDELQAIEESEDYNRFLNYGLTKREYFAAMAMQGLISNSLSGRGPNGCAQDSVRFADALIEELNK